MFLAIKLEKKRVQTFALSVASQPDTGMLCYFLLRRFIRDVMVASLLIRVHKGVEMISTE